MNRVNTKLILKQQARLTLHLNKMHDSDINTAQSQNNEKTGELLSKSTM
jgi:hypothetical protein